jgi:hypothetical protein
MTRATNIALEEHRSPKGSARRLTSQWYPHISVVSSHLSGILTSQWYKDAGGTLLIRWVVEPEPEQRRLLGRLAA